MTVCASCGVESAGDFKFCPHCGSPVAVPGHARQAVAVAEQTDAINDHADALADLAEVLTLAGRPEDAAVELEKALMLYEQKGNLVSAEGARTRLAELRT